MLEPLRGPHLCTVLPSSRGGGDRCQRVDDQSVCLHLPEDFFVVDGRMLNSISMSPRVWSWDSPWLLFWIPCAELRMEWFQDSTGLRMQLTCIAGFRQQILSSCYAGEMPDSRAYRIGKQRSFLPVHMEMVKNQLLPHGMV